jgi:hypothetical protein
MNSWLRRRRVDGQALMALIHARMLRRQRRERGRRKIGRRPGEDPTCRIGSSVDALDVAEALLEPLSHIHKTDEVWRSNALAPLAGVLYAASPCGNGEGIAWVSYATMTVDGAGWREAAEICRADVWMLADVLDRTAKMDPRQRESLRRTIRLAITPYVTAAIG